MIEELKEQINILKLEILMEENELNNLIDEYQEIEKEEQ